MGYLDRLFESTKRENRRAILALLPRVPGCELLDLGCGDGAFTERVGERVGAGRLYGIELTSRGEGARRRGVQVVQADLERPFPFADGRFGFVHANQVVEHVRATDTFLAEMCRVLAPGGIACISTNNFASWHNVLALALGHQPMPAHVSDRVIVGNPLDPWAGRRHPDPAQAHVRVFTRRALRELCEHSGLRTLRLAAAGYYPLPPALARLAARLDPGHAAYVTGLFER